MDSGMKRMPDRPETWAWLSAWLEHNWPAIYAGLLAAVMGGLRIIYGGGTWRRVILESLMCGLAALSASHGLALFGIPLSTAPFFGGVIGLLGIEFTRAVAKRHFNRKVDQL